MGDELKSLEKPQRIIDILWIQPELYRPTHAYEWRYKSTLITLGVRSELGSHDPGQSNSMSLG